MTPATNQAQMATKLELMASAIVPVVISRSDPSAVSAHAVAEYAINVAKHIILLSSIQFAPPPTILPFPKNEQPTE